MQNKCLLTIKWIMLVWNPSLNKENEKHLLKTKWIYFKFLFPWLLSKMLIFPDLKLKFPHFFQTYGNHANFQIHKTKITFHILNLVLISQ